ncbi:MAG: PUA domain-containing protein [Promethearchaeota archaeon]
MEWGLILEKDLLLLRKVESIVERQFGSHFSQFLHEVRSRLSVQISRKTGKIRYVYLDDKLILVLRPVDGFFTLSIQGASILHDLEKNKGLINGIQVQTDVEEFIKKGGQVFAKHVTNVPENLHPAQEIYACNEQGELLAVGKAVLSGRDMLFFNKGVAMKTRHGVEKN